MAKRKNKNRPLHKVILGELFFWVHTVIILFMIVAGLFISFWLVLAFGIFVKVQQVVFHGCVLTRLEEAEGGIKRGMAYYQLAAKRFFGVRLSHFHMELVSITISLWSVIFAAYCSWHHVHLV